MKYWVVVIFLAVVSFGVSAAFSFWQHRVIEIPVQASLQTGEPVGQEDVLLPVGEDVDAQGESITLYFVGDIMLGRAVEAQMMLHDDFRYPFLEIAEELLSADVLFGNLEGPISLRGENVGSKYSFRFDPRVMDGLVFAGFDVLSLANNHIWDWGRDALGDTIDILEERGMRGIGAGRDMEEANREAVVCVGQTYRDIDVSRFRDAEEMNLEGCSGTSVGFLAYTNLYPEGLRAGADYPGVSDFSRENMVGSIRALALDVDVVVVSIHWGVEYETESNAYQKELGRAFADAGADLVIGHHPHVVQEVEEYKDSWIAYSLGNFVFDQNFSRETMEGIVLRAVVRDGGVQDIEILETEISDTYQVLF